MFGDVVEGRCESKITVVLLCVRDHTSRSGPVKRSEVKASPASPGGRGVATPL